MRRESFLYQLAQIIIHRGFVKLSLMLMFAETDEICKHAPKVPRSRTRKLEIHVDEFRLFRAPATIRSASSTRTGVFETVPSKFQFPSTT